MSDKVDDTLARKRTRTEKVASQDSTCSVQTEISKSPKDVLALGQVIVRQLELPDRGAVLERWLAHHLAELIAEADQAVGATKAAYEAQAVDLILKLWVHRRALPETVDPLGGYRKAIDVLGLLLPDANPWARLRQPNNYDGLLREMFELLGKIVLAGVMLTQVSRVRPTTEEELNALEDQELQLLSTLEQWKPVVAHAPLRPEIEIKFVNAGITESNEANRESERVYSSHKQNHKSDKPVGSNDASLHAEIALNLERMQTALNDLLTRWRESSLGESVGEKENRS